MKTCENKCTNIILCLTVSKYASSARNLSISCELSTPVANNVYIKKIYAKISFTYAENVSSSGVSQPHFNFSLKHLTGQTTQKSCDTKKQSICG